MYIVLSAIVHKTNTVNKMRVLGYCFQAQIKGEGKSGLRRNSLIRIEIGIENGEDYVPDMIFGDDYVKLFGDKITVDTDGSGKDYEKYFSFSQEMVDGSVTATLKLLFKDPLVLINEGWVTKSNDNK